MEKLRSIFSRRILFPVVGIASLIIFCATLKTYEGSKLLYTLFSLTFALLFFVSFYKPKFYVTCFLSVFLYLGFWLKFSIHTIFKTDYWEPFGSFSYMPAAWDKVLLVAMIGVLGVILAVACTYLFSKNNPINTVDFSDKAVPQIYKQNRKLIYGLIIFAIIGWSVINVVFGVHQTGLHSQLSLPSYLFFVRYLISWPLTCAFSILLCFTLYWDFQLKDQKVPSFYLILIESFFSNVSTLSRAYIFRTVPAILATAKEKKFFDVISNAQKVLLIFVFCFCMVFSLFCVNQLRNRAFHMDELISSVQKNTNKEYTPDRSFGRFVSMFVERWLGVEGVMSVTSYKDVGKDLILETFLESSKKQGATVYDQKVALSPYTFMDGAKFQFGTLPGGVAFFYMSGSQLITFFGMFLLTLLFIFIEYFIFRIQQNPFLSSFYGMNGALAISQFGYRPISTFLFYAMFVITVIFIKYVVLWLSGVVSPTTVPAIKSTDQIN